MALWVSCGKPATLEQMVEHAIVLQGHVPEHTIAFQRTPEQAMALWNKLRHMFQTKNTLEHAMALWATPEQGANITSIPSMPTPCRYYQNWHSLKEAVAAGRYGIPHYGTLQHAAYFMGKLWQHVLRHVAAPAP
ncbi:hypothetical protein BKA82DRAFT_4017352 [Pisolithus tinctorius]|nr:hypothetical protein BKA82DRAFT_4017352 [Pisolithus tinctorius]